jgi:hypothetical protein
MSLRKIGGSIQGQIWKQIAEYQADAVRVGSFETKQSFHFRRPGACIRAGTSYIALYHVL